MKRRKGRKSGKSTNYPASSNKIVLGCRTARIPATSKTNLPLIRKSPKPRRFPTKKIQKIYLSILSSSSSSISKRIMGRTTISLSVFRKTKASIKGTTKDCSERRSTRGC